MRDLGPVSVGTEERRRAATALIRCGVSVIPIPAGEKNPNRPDWQDERHTAEDVPFCWTNGQKTSACYAESPPAAV